MLTTLDGAFWGYINMTVLLGSASRSGLRQVAKQTAVSEVNGGTCLYHVTTGTVSEREQLERLVESTFQFRGEEANWRFTRSPQPLPVICEAYVQTNSFVPLPLFTNLIQIYCKGPSRLMEVSALRPARRLPRLLCMTDAALSSF